MSGKGRFYDFGWHVEYHTVDKKKQKAADCVYLTADRICQNSKSVQYLGKCFMASYCPVRLREIEEKEQEEKKAKETSVKEPSKPQIKKINCMLSKNCPIQHKRLGKGRYVGYDAENMYISIQFGEKIAKFKYPNAILDKFLVVPVNEYNRVLKDVAQAEKG